MPMDNPSCHHLHHEYGASPTLPSSLTRSSSSSSDFEFTVVLSPRKSNSSLSPADDLFYKGQLLPLQLSPRISLAHTLHFSLPCSSSETSRNSTGSSIDSSLPSSVTADQNDLAKFPDVPNNKISNRGGANHNRRSNCRVKNDCLVFSKFSSVFLCMDIKQEQCQEADALPGPVKRTSVTAKEVIGKYLKKMKQKLSSQKQRKSAVSRAGGTPREVKFDPKNTGKTVQWIVNPLSHSISRYSRHTRKRSWPSSMDSSPSHSGVLNGDRHRFSTGSSSDVSSKEELQDAIQGAIAHCKNSMSATC